MYGPNRYVCSVLDEMRKSLKSIDPRHVDEHIFSKLVSLQGLLIEEAQTMVNRMEAALDDNKCIREMEETMRELKTDIKKLRAKKKELKDE